MSIGILIYGARCTGKTTLELNLRNIITGSYAHKEPYYQHFPNDICFIGYTCNSKGRVLATAGSERLKNLVDIPKSKYYVATVTPGYDKAGVLDFYKTLDEVHAICMFVKNRQTFYEARCLRTSGKCKSTLGPAKMAHPPIECWEYPFHLIQGPNALVACMTFLGLPYKEYEYIKEF